MFTDMTPTCVCPPWMPASIYEVLFSLNLTPYPNISLKLELGLAISTDEKLGLRIVHF